MTTLKLTYDPDSGDCDLTATASEYARDESLETAVLISLFSDARVDKADLPGGGDRKGWWGDSFLDDDDESLGSKLWLLETRKNTAESERLARAWAEEALAWMVADGVASRVEVQTNRSGNCLELFPQIFIPGETEPSLIGPYKLVYDAI